MVGGFTFKKVTIRSYSSETTTWICFQTNRLCCSARKGFAPNTIILDAPFVESQGVGLKNWKPENYGKKFYGPSTLRKGIEYSRNLMTVRIAKF